MTKSPFLLSITRTATKIHTTLIESPPHRIHQLLYLPLRNCSPFLKKKSLYASRVLINVFIYCPAKNIPQVLNAWHVRRHWRLLKSLNTIQLQVVVHNPSTVGPHIVVLKDGILAHLTEIWYNMRSENFVNVPSAIHVPRHNDKGSSCILTNTCPYHNTSTVVCRCWLDRRF